MGNSKKTAEPPPSEAELEQMTVAELKDLAKTMGVHVPYDANKDEIIQLIMEAEPPQDTQPPQEAASPQQAGSKSNGGVITPAIGVTPFVGTGYQPPGTFGPVAPVVPAYVANPQPIKVSDLFGIGAEYQLPLNVLQLSASQATPGKFLLDNIPAGMIMQYVRVKHSIPVLGTGGTCLAQVTDGSGLPSNNTYGSTLDVTQAVADAASVTAQPTTGNLGNISSPTPIYLNFTGTGTLANATQGQVNVWIRYCLLA